MAHMVRVLNLASYKNVEEFESEIAAYLDDGWHIAESGGAGAGGTGDSDSLFLNYYVIMVKQD